MSIIDDFKNKVDLRTIALIKDPYRKYRTLYFENNVDVRLCPKNGNTTLRSVWSQLFYGSTENCSTGFRKQLFEENKKNGNIDESNYIFRKNSYRIAVKRDPVERALSAAKEVLKQEFDVLEPSLEILEELLYNISIDVKEHLLSENRWAGINHHFLSQTYSMGNAYDYDEVYDIQDLDKLVKWLEEDYNYPYKITDTHLNKSISNVKVADLSREVVEHIYKIYEIDYRNGWF